MCWSSPFYLFWVDNILNKGAVKRKIVWRWFKANPAFSKTYFNFCNGFCCNLANDEQHLYWRSIFYLFWAKKFWTKALPKGKLLEDDLNSTLHQFRKGFSTFAMEPVAIWQTKQCTNLMEKHFLPVLLVKILNKGAAKGQIAWSWFKLYPAPVQEGSFLLQFGIVLEQPFLPGLGYKNSE